WAVLCALFRAPIRVLTGLPVGFLVGVRIRFLFRHSTLLLPPSNSNVAPRAPFQERTGEWKRLDGNVRPTRPGSARASSSNRVPPICYRPPRAASGSTTPGRRAAALITFRNLTGY